MDPMMNDLDIWWPLKPLRTRNSCHRLSRWSNGKLFCSFWRFKELTLQNREKSTRNLREVSCGIEKCHENNSPILKDLKDWKGFLVVLHTLRSEKNGGFLPLNHLFEPHFPVQTIHLEVSPILGNPQIPTPFFSDLHLLGLLSQLVFQSLEFFQRF